MRNYLWEWICWAVYWLSPRKIFSTILDHYWFVIASWPVKPSIARGMSQRNLLSHSGLAFEPKQSKCQIIQQIKISKAISNAQVDLPPITMARINFRLFFALNIERSRTRHHHCRLRSFPQITCLNVVQVVAPSPTFLPGWLSRPISRLKSQSSGYHEVTKLWDVSFIKKRIKRLRNSKLHSSWVQMTSVMLKSSLIINLS
jgi:hypothetical protein